MTFFPPGNFNDISSIINESKNVLSDLSEAENAIIAFRRQFPPLINFIKSHIIEIVEKALLKVPAKSKSERDFCFMIFCSNVPAFDLSLSTNHQFLKKISDFITNSQDQTFDSLASFNLMMHSLIKNTNGYILVAIPEKEKFIGNIFNLIEYRPIYSLLHFLSDEGKQYISEFLDTDLFASHLFNFIDKTPRRVLQLLLNLIKSSKADSNFMKYVTQTNNLSTVYSIAMTSKFAFTSSKAFNFFIETCQIYSKSDDEDSSYEYEEEEEDSSPKIFEFLNEKLQNLCKFICQEPFILSHSSACKLLNYIIPQIKQIPNEIYKTAENLFEMMFKYPHHSLLHLSCANLFQTLLEADKNLFKKIDVRTKIIWANKNLINDYKYNFWGHLFLLSKLIVDSETNFDSECEGWDDYINTTFKDQEKIISSPYGGKCPKDKRAHDFLSTIIIE